MAFTWSPEQAHPDPRPWHVRKPPCTRERRSLHEMAAKATTIYTTRDSIPHKYTYTWTHLLRGSKAREVKIALEEELSPLDGGRQNSSPSNFKCHYPGKDTLGLHLSHVCPWPSWPQQSVAFMNQPDEQSVLFIGFSLGGGTGLSKVKGALGRRIRKAGLSPVTPSVLAASMKCREKCPPHGLRRDM